MIWNASAASVTGPKFRLPRQSRLTDSPVRPRWVYCMVRPPQEMAGCSDAQVSLDDVRPREHLLRSALGQQTAVVHDQHSVADARDERDIVVDDDHGDLGPGHLLEHV